MFAIILRSKFLVFEDMKTLNWIEYYSLKKFYLFTSVMLTIAQRTGAERGERECVNNILVSNVRTK